ncbi:DUF805 domain-containing protein [Kiloniella antarctica]|uniref:DUF805 domain-containing protein n=1 Tax=Kiloniella antarctica TaxID=1550907 RepID=A0ABW5BH69_9PROT
MGTFSIFHWLIVLVVLFIIFGLPLLAVIFEKSEKRITRLVFLYWIIAYFGGAFFIETLGDLTGFTEIADPAIGIFILAMSYPFYQRVVRRARDAEMSKKIAYISVIPIVYFICFLILIIKPSKEPPNEDVFA